MVMRSWAFTAITRARSSTMVWFFKSRAMDVTLAKLGKFFSPMPSGKKLIALAIDDPTNGFRQQIAKGVMADGMWIEGSSGYHFFTISGLIPLAEAARNCGINLYTEKFCSMFEGPLALAMPNLVLPN